MTVNSAYNPMILKTPISKRWLCHIDVTNHCQEKFSCVYCTRYIKHLRPDQKYFMPLDYFSKALNSLIEFPGRIGIMGGLPTMHPKFESICKILQERIPRSKLQLWVSGEPTYYKYMNIINETFFCTTNNEHTDTQKELCQHQVTTLASKEVIPDEKFRRSLIENCWVLRDWCPTIGYLPSEPDSYKSAFICELMFGQEIILGKHAGIDFVEDPYWWNRSLNDAEYSNQLETYCGYCSMCIPMKRQMLADKKERISPELHKLLSNNGSKYTSSNHCEIVSETISESEIDEVLKTGWEPKKYRGDLPGGES
jgi:hypothetical protein